MAMIHEGKEYNVNSVRFGHKTGRIAALGQYALYPLSQSTRKKTKAEILNPMLCRIEHLYGRHKSRDPLF